MKKIFILFLLLTISISAQFLYNFGPDMPNQNVLKKSALFGESLPCEINITCDSKGFLSVSDGIFMFNGCTAFFLTNTLNDGRLLFMTANHVFPSNIPIGGTTTITVKFNYQSQLCSNPTEEPSIGVYSSNLVVKLLVRTNVDQVLCEIVNDGSLQVNNITLLGWDTRYDAALSLELAFVGHPKSDIKKIAYPEITGLNSLNIWTRVLKGNGAVEVGYSGAPLLGKINGNFRVYSLVSSGSVYGCDDNIQSYITTKNIGAEWSLLSPYLDPLNSNALFCDGIESVLPVELISFAALVVNNVVKLNWTTATEVNNYGFDIEKKILNSNWRKIGFVQGHGNSNSVKDYYYTDATNVTGKTQYRLKQIDFDGKFEYSNAVEVDVQAPTEFKLAQNFPNPFNPSTKISYQLSVSSFATLKVYDILGREVATLVNEFENAGTYEVKFNASNLPSGMYVYKITCGDFVETKKMLLMK